VLNVYLHVVIAKCDHLRNLISDNTVLHLCSSHITLIHIVGTVLLVMLCLHLCTLCCSLSVSPVFVFRVSLCDLTKNSDIVGQFFLRYRCTFHISYLYNILWHFTTCFCDIPLFSYYPFRHVCIYILEYILYFLCICILFLSSFTEQIVYAQLCDSGTSVNLTWPSQVNKWWQLFPNPFSKHLVDVATFWYSKVHIFVKRSIILDMLCTLMSQHSLPERNINTAFYLVLGTAWRAAGN
jgi:hypothetical protein